MQQGLCHLLRHGLCHARVCIVEGHVHGAASDLVLDVPGGHAASQASTNPAPAQAQAAPTAVSAATVKCDFTRPCLTSCWCDKQGAASDRVSCSVLTAGRRQHGPSATGRWYSLRDFGCRPPNALGQQRQQAGGALCQPRSCRAQYTLRDAGRSSGSKPAVVSGTDNHPRRAEH